MSIKKFVLCVFLCVPMLAILIHKGLALRSLESNPETSRITRHVNSSQAETDLVEEQDIEHRSDILAPAVDRRRSLLESPWKFGFGSNATGAGKAGKLYEVTNTNDKGPGSLRRGLEQSGNWVVYDDSLDGKTIFIDSHIKVASDITWDGRDALVRVAPALNLERLTLFRFYEGNAIVHRVLYGPVEDQSGPKGENNKTTANFTGIVVGEGEDYWFDHIETNNMDDDSFGIGRNSYKSAINITITHYKVYKANKGMLIAQDKIKQQQTGRIGRVTIAFSDFSARCRNFRSAGSNFTHGLNNYSHNFGSERCGNVAAHGTKSSKTGRGMSIVLAESSVYDSDGIVLGGFSDEVGGADPFSVQGYVFTDGQNQYFRGEENDFVFGPDEQAPSNLTRPIPPYEYSKLNADVVRDYVMNNAGVHGENIPYIDK